MDKWKPNNYMGYWSYDPRDELKHRLHRAEQAYDKFVAIPMLLAHALAELRECDATTVTRGDEDGPMEPLTIRCRRIKDHQHKHSNGYVSWD